MNTTIDAEKLRRLSNLKQEVNDFHPLLRMLFPKMPRVKGVEYTHGSTEMGADFIISRLDDTFGTLDYIGIVAKVGKMDQESITEIDRQIDECFIQKHFESGKKAVYLNEVWVVTTGSFTNNAKIKIHDKYRSKKIVFIGRDKLIELIDSFTPNFWTDLALEIGEYLYVLRQRNEEAEIRLSLLKDHRDIYIEQDLYRVSENEYKAKKLRGKNDERLDPAQCVKDSSIVIVEGEMGAGKSKLLRHLVKHFTTPEVYLDTKYIPVSLSYKILIDKYDGDLDAVIKDHIKNNGLTELMDGASYVFLIDGVDEKNLPSDEQIETLIALIDKIKSNANFKAVIATRFLSALDSQKEKLKGALRLELRPMGLQRIIKFIETLCSEISIPKRIFEDLRKSPLFKQLPKTPIAAILLAELLNENSQDLPSNLPELYSKYLELMLGRWDIDKGLQSQKEYEALDSVMMQLSTFMIDNEMTFISVPDARNIVDTYLKKRNLNITSEKLFALMIERSGILTLDSSGNRLSFKHRTFAEYFFAKSKVRARNFVIDDRAFGLYWANIFYFFVGLLKDCPEVLDTLTRLKPKDEGQQIMKLVNTANYLLAGFASPYDSVERGVAVVMREAAELYHGIASGRVNSPSSKFSEMQLLWVFQMVIRQSYSFEFFLKAIETASLEIGADGAISNDVKAYALFFLNVSYIEAGGRHGFDFILKDYAKLLPISVQMGIHHEGKKLADRTVLMRRQDRALMKSIKGNKQFESLLDVMYEKPLRQVTKMKSDSEK